MYLSGNNWTDIHRKMQCDLSAVIDWTFRNNLRLILEKTKAMIFSTRNRLSKLQDPVPFVAGGKSIKFVNNHVYLGVTLDPAMTLSPMRKFIKKRVSNKIFRLRKIRKYLTFDAALLIYKQTILPIIDYVGFLLIASIQSDLDELQVLQNDILRICKRTQLADRVSIPELHSRCNIISIKQRMQKQVLWLMYLLSKEPSYLHVPARHTRTTDKVQFKVPTKIFPIYEHSPYYIGTKLCNDFRKRYR